MTIAVTEDTFDTTIEQGIVLVDWWAAWCGPCRMFAPIFDAAARRHPDIVFAKIDVEAEPQIAAGYEIQSIPTLMAFRDGILVYTRAGVLPAEALEKLIGKLRALDMSEVRKLAARSAG